MLAAGDEVGNEIDGRTAHVIYRLGMYAKLVRTGEWSPAGNARVAIDRVAEWAVYSDGFYLLVYFVLRGIHLRYLFAGVPPLSCPYGEDQPEKLF